MVKKSLLLMLLVALVVMGSGCAKGIIDVGTVSEQNIYSNEYFKMNISLPENWTIASEEEMNQMMEAGNEIAVGDDTGKKLASELSKLKTVYLFIASNPNGNGSSFVGIAENLSFNKDIKSGVDYLNHVKIGLEEHQDQIPYQFNKDIYTKNIDGKEFGVLEAMVDIGAEVPLMQYYYVAIENNYALCFISTSVTDEDLMILTNILPTVSFE